MAAQVACGSCHSCNLLVVIRIPLIIIHSAETWKAGLVVFNRLCSAMLLTFAVHVTELVFVCLEVSFAERLACFKIDTCSNIQLANLQS